MKPARSTLPARSTGSARLAFRIARRMAAQSVGRSVLVAILVAIPVLGMAGMATVEASNNAPRRASHTRAR
ncbi:hypothetical protein EDD25_0414 [Cryobacterium psychrophilum]|nr:hypothetical protein EDD25_0414 [Cryobacterium psychrophilum]